MKKKLPLILVLGILICIPFVSAGFFDWITDGLNKITGKVIEDGCVSGVQIGDFLR